MVLKKLNYVYQNQTPFTHQALFNISSVIPGGSFTMIVGKTGSGKSTLLQQLDALLLPTSGTIKFGKVAWGSSVSRKKVRLIRQRIGIVFQIPSKQLFGDTVKDDLMFGPLNFHFNECQSKRFVQQSLKLLKIPNDLLFKSPFDLSGGQMKKVAIAGVLACHPEILLLDEPTVGLDEVSSMDLMKLIERLRLKYHLTIIMVTHEMNWVAKYATQVLVLKRGRLVADGSPLKLFQNRQLMLKTGLMPPFTIHFFYLLRHYGIYLKRIPLDQRTLADAIVRKLEMKG